ncbi:craniofacial development protein 2-like [Culicoides brevitarsis]|uniref:craniofacial development protein 2-like n=1 Tax=Culicoides brevitarsis TaxID=469753 RepID=UPI00307CA18D
MDVHDERINSLIGTRRGLPASDPEANRNIGASSHHYPGESNMKFMKLRFSTWNIGSLTGKSSELANLMQRRRIDIMGLQETKWKGQKSKSLPHGFKLLYNGSNNKRNGVAIIVSSFMATKIINVTRTNDRIMMIKLALPKLGIWNIISAYGPQTGCTAEEKAVFWQCLEGLMENIPLNEKKIILSDLNGHVGKNNLLQTPIHGGFGYGEINAQGKDILNYATAHNLAIVNTFFSKQNRHLITYSSDRHNTQIDYTVKILS